MMGGIGQMIFGMIFNFMLMMLFAPKPKDTISYGPRLDNLKPAVKDIQGQVINLTYGTTRISGTVFWASDIRETAHSDTTEYSSKGGGGDYTHTDVTYTYDCDVAVGICEGPIVGIRKIWANKDLIYDVDQKPSALSWLKYEIFSGSESQSPSTLMQANFGYENVPAHRGLAYIVFEQFQLDPFGRRLPQSFEFEVVAKGTVYGTAKRYTQVSQLLYGDTGNFYYSYAYPAGFRNSAYKFSILQWDVNNYIIPVNNDNQLLYVKLDAATGNVIRYHVNPGYFTCPGDYYTGGAYYWPDWGIGTTSFAFMKVSFMGVNFKYVPCMIVNGGVSFSSGNSAAAFFVVNLVNNNVIATRIMPNCMMIGSFNQFHWSGVYNNSITAQQYTDGYGQVFTANIKDEFCYTATNAEQVDEYGMLKGTDRRCLVYNKEYALSNPSRLISVSGVEFLSSYHVHLIGFPSEVVDSRDTSECMQSIFGMEDTYTITTTTCTVTDIHINYTDDYTNINAIYEGYTYSIVDEMEQDKVCRVRVQKAKSVKEYRCHDDQLLNTTNTTTNYWYPSTFGDVVNTYDTDPLGQDPNPPYDKHISLVVKRAIFTHDISNSNYRPINWDNCNVTKWIKFKNGDELLALRWRNDGISSDIYGIYRKGIHSSYLTNTNVDPLENMFGYYFYQQYTTSASRNPVLPNKYYTQESYTPNQQFLYGGSCTYDLNNSHTSANKENPFTLALAGGSMPYTSYWSRGMKKIYWMWGNTIYYYDLITNTTVADFSTSVSCTNVLPFGGDYLGTNINGDLYGREYANIYYLSRNITTQPAVLGEIIEDLTEKAGINLSVLDISTAAYNTEVFGFNVSDDIKLIDALESLLMHYFIDAFESEWKIKFRTRKEYTDNGTNIATIDNNELGIREIGENYNEKYKITVREDTQLPQSINYAYISAEAGFIQANVTAIRNIDFNIGIKSTIKCPMALKTTEAYNNAFRILFDVWRSTKEFEFRLPKEYSYLEPGDLVLLPVGASKTSNEYLIIKITEVTAESKAYLEFKGLEEDARNLEGIINDGAFEPKVSTLVPLSVTSGIPLDTSPLYNKWNNIDYTNPVVYYTTYGNNMSWRGGGIFVSYDGLAFYEVSKYGPFSAAAGQIVSVTNYTIDKNYTDYINSITIQTLSVQEFFSVDDSDYYYREGNLLAIYKSASDTIEFIQYYNLVKDTTNPELITITGLTRGMYNTIPGNAISQGDYVVLLPVGAQKVSVSTEYYNKQIQYKLVSYGQNLDNVEPSLYTYKCKWYTPYNVSNFKSVLSGSDIALTWTSRERNKPSYLLYSPDQIDTKEYTLKIYDKFDVLKRTVTGILADTYTYSSTDLTTDGFTTNSYIKFTLQRKATFLEYSHSIIDSTVYVGDEISILQELSNNNLLIYFKTNAATGTTISPAYGKDGFQTLTYNNYTGKGYSRKDNCFYTDGAIKPNKNDVISCTSTNNSSRHTISFWIKVTTNGTSEWSDNYILDANLDGGPGWAGGFDITVKNDNKITVYITHSGCFGFYVNYLPQNDWVFIAVTYDPITSGRPASIYARAPSGSYYYAYAYNSNNTCWGGANVYGRNEFFKKVSPDGVLDYQIQDFTILTTDLYIDAGRTFSYIEALYNLGLKKWQR
jgi:hypothetical protein